MSANNLAWTAGLTNDEIEARATQLLPASVVAEVKEEGPDPSVLLLTLKRSDEVVLSTHIHKTNAVPNPPPDLLRMASNKTLGEVEETITNFKRDYVRGLIKEFDLDQFLKDEYSDKNVIYKVPRRYTTEHAPRYTTTTNLDNYYLGRLRALTPHFQPFWEYLVMNDSSHPDRLSVMEYAHGLMIRLEQLTFSLDRIRELDKLGPDNDILFLVNYHLTHFISMVKSIGDNLAWLLKVFFDIKGHDEKKTDLLMKGFLEKIRLKDHHLYGRIAGKTQLTTFENHKLFRDIVQHRHALHVVHINFQASREEHLMVPANPMNGAFEEFGFPILALTKDKESMAKFGMKQLIVKFGSPETPGYERLETFCDRHLDAISFLCEQVFTRLNQLLRRDPIGEVYGYLSKSGVALVSLSKDLAVGSRILVEGRTTLVEQSAESIQVEHQSVQEAKAGQRIGVRVDSKARRNDVVYCLLR